MHEMSLAEGMLQIVEDTARANGLARVRDVWVEIGRLSQVEPEAMRFCFDAVTRGSVADGARLHVVDVPGSAWCLRCSQPVSIGSRADPCPECGTWQLQVTGGTELRVLELEAD